MAENSTISIMCPKCGKFLAKADRRDSEINKLRCKHCGKWIWYKPSDDDYREIKNVPQKNTSSGVRFW